MLLMWFLVKNHFTLICQIKNLSSLLLSNLFLAFLSRSICHKEEDDSVTTSAPQSHSRGTPSTSPTNVEKWLLHAGNTNNHGSSDKDLNPPLQRSSCGAISEHSESESLVRSLTTTGANPAKRGEKYYGQVKRRRNANKGNYDHVDTSEHEIHQGKISTSSFCITIV